MGKKYGYINELKSGEECYLVAWIVFGETHDRRVRYTGTHYLPEGGCSHLFKLIDIDTGKEVEAMSESYTRPKDW